MSALTKAESAFARLNGVICVYKSSNTSLKVIANRIKENLCRDLNNLETRPQQDYVEVNRSQSYITLSVRPRYADHVLCVGPRYQPEDIYVSFPTGLFNFMSGVLVVGINMGRRVSSVLRNLSLTRCFHVKGILGQASEDFYSNSRIVARAKYEQITQYYIERVLSSYQSFNQRKLFEEYGVNMKSEEAYKLAVSGLHRPQDSGATILYSLNCVEFNPPNFTIEVQCINETDNYLKQLIHDVGVSTKALATCSGMRCIRQGCFKVDHALISKQWTLENILENMNMCYDLLEKNISTNANELSVVGTQNKTKKAKPEFTDSEAYEFCNLNNDFQK